MKNIAKLMFPVTPLEAASQWQCNLRTATERLLKAKRDGLLFRVRSAGRWYYTLTETGLAAVTLYY